MTIGARLALGFGAVLALMMVLTALAVSRVGDIDATLNRINDVNNVKQRHAINFRGSVHDRAIALRDVQGVGPSMEQRLTAGGLSTVEQLASATIEQLSAIKGIGEKTAEKLIQAAKRALAKAQEPSTAAAPPQQEESAPEASAPPASAESSEPPSGESPSNEPSDSKPSEQQ